MTNINNKKYNSIDLCKFVMAIFVIAIHTNPLSGIKNQHILNVYECIVNCAVPFFFMASGYLLAINLTWPYHSEIDIKKIKKYLMKIIKLYLVWSVIYMPLAISDCINSGQSFFQGVYLYINRLIFVGDHYNSWILWYLLSTIYALIFIIMLMKKHISPYVVCIIGFAVFCISIGFDYLVLYEIPFSFLLEILKKIVLHSVLNGRIFRGIFYLPCGMVLAQHKIKNRKSLIALFCLSFMICCMISNLLLKSILMVIYNVSLFIIVKDIEWKDMKIYSILRKMSTSMYFIHLYIWTFYYHLVYGEKTFGLDSFLVTSSVAIVISFIYVVLKNKKQPVKY